MAEVREHSQEFIDAWQKLKPLLKEPGFKLDAYLAEASATLSPETIRELRIAIKLAQLKRLDAEYNRWRQAETSRDAKRQNFRASFNRLGWAAAAAILIVSLLISPFRQTPMVEEPGFTLLGTIFLPQAVYAAASSLDIPVGTDPIGTFRSMNGKGNFRYADIDNDNKLDFIFVQDGHVVVFGLDGKVKGHYEITTDKLDPDFLPNLVDVATFQHNTAKIYPNLSPYNPLYPWKMLPDNLSLNAAWPLLKADLSILDLCDFDGDQNLEIILWFHGCVIALNEKLEQKSYIIDNAERKEIVVLDGTRQDAPKAIADLNGDGEKEFIVYRMPGYPQALDGTLLSTQVMPDKTKGYMCDGEDKYNTRGVYVTTYLGKELWHLNLPYHCAKINIGDWDNDGLSEFTIDVNLPNNNYWVDYTPNKREKIARGFLWDSWNACVPSIIKYLRDTHDPDQPPDANPETRDLAFFIFGMEEKGTRGKIEYFEAVDGPSKNRFFTSRFIKDGDTGQFDRMEYAIDWDDRGNEIGWWYKPWRFDRTKKRYVECPGGVGGYPNMYNSTGQVVFGFKNEKGNRKVFCLTRSGRIMLTDDYYNEIASYTINPDENGEHISWTYRSFDCMVYDVKDFNGDGSLEILAGFGDFLSPPGDRNRGYYSILKVFTQDLKPFYPELGWDTFVVQGPIIDARFEKVDADDQMDIVVISDFAYLLTPGK